MLSSSARARIFVIECLKRFKIELCPSRTHRYNPARPLAPIGKGIYRRFPKPQFQVRVLVGVFSALSKFSLKSIAPI